MESFISNMRNLNACIKEGFNTPRSESHHMRILNAIEQNAVVTPEEYRYIELEIKKALEAPTPGRRLMGITGPVGLGKTAYQYDKDSNMSAAIISHYFEANRDLIDTARTTVEVPIIQKNFRMPRRDLDASRSAGTTALDVRNARNALQRVKVAETTLIVQGWTADGTNYDISGLYQSAGTTEATSKDFGTYGNAQAKIGLAMAALDAVGTEPPYNLALATTQYGQLVGSFSTAGVSEYKTVKEMIEGEIIHCADLTAATGMLLPTAENGKSNGYFDYVVGKDYTTEYWQVANQATEGCVFVTGVPIIAQATTICSLTSI